MIVYDSLQFRKILYSDFSFVHYIDQQKKALIGSYPRQYLLLVITSKRSDCCK